MRTKFILLISFLLTSNFTFSQQNFIPHNITTGGQPNSTKLCDMDGDSDLDILVFAYGDHSVAWYRNTGNGYFDDATVISKETEYVVYVLPSDLDDDGDIDVLCCEHGQLCWYQNAGNGSFGSAQIICNANTSYDFAAIFDLDNDSIEDIIISSSADSILVWYKNLGNGNFASQQIIVPIASGYFSFHPTDLDQDGKIDLLCIDTEYSSNFIYATTFWYKNLGSGSFGPEQFIDSIGSYYICINTADLDNNGFPDIIASQSYGVSLKTNLGGGNFSNTLALNNSLGAPYFSLVDMDGDNDLDIIITDLALDILIWQENLGMGILGPSQMICDSLPDPIWSCTGDIDNDGDIDIITSTSIHSTLEVFLNSGTNTFNHFQRISYAAASVMDVHAADIDNDGLLDILSASRADDKIAWYKNLGNKQFSLQKEISTSVNRANSVTTADLDMDGHEDVVAGGWGNEVIWFHDFHNDALFGACDTIPNSYSNVFRIVTKDLDNDSLPDVIWNSSGGLLWSKNLGSGNFGSPQPLYFIWDIDCVEVEDLNNDSLPDIILSNDHSIYLGINNGGGTFLPIDTINQNIGAKDVELIDMDDDGDIDIVFQGNQINTQVDYLGWYPNDGFGNFDTTIIIPSVGDMSYGIEATDIDNDGDIDIFTGLHNSLNYDHNLAWYENLGSANFGPPVAIEFGMKGVWDIYASDLDNDGDKDLLLALLSNSTVQWLENTLNNVIDTVFICPDDSTLIFNNWVSLPGHYTDTLQNSLGGDSINIIVLAEYPTYQSYDTAYICEGEVYEFNGQSLATSGNYYANFQSVLGCDSIEELSLEVIPGPVVSISPFMPDSVSIDAGLQILPAATPAGGTYSGTGVIASDFDPALAGPGEFWISYTVVDTTTGCSGQDSTLIKVYDPIGIEELEHNNVKLYPNPGTGDFILTGTILQSVQIRTIAGELVKEVGIKDRSEVHFNMTEQAKGIYFIHILNNNTQIRKVLILM